MIADLLFHRIKENLTIHKAHTVRITAHKALAHTARITTTADLQALLATTDHHTLQTDLRILLIDHLHILLKVEAMIDLHHKVADLLIQAAMTVHTLLQEAVMVAADLTDHKVVIVADATADVVTTAKHWIFQRLSTK